MYLMFASFTKLPIIRVTQLTSSNSQAKMAGKPTPLIDSNIKPGI